MINLVKNRKVIVFCSAVIIFSVLFISVVVFIINNDPTQSTLINNDPTQSTLPKKWTFLFYDDADFYNAYDPLEDFAAAAFSGKNINVLVLRDKEHTIVDMESGDRWSADMWYIDKDHKKEQLETMGELNMGDPETLTNFIQYAKENFPAERYLLAIYNHGMGWEGSCIDQTNNDWLSMNELQSALNNSGNIDLICFTAPCLMGSLEAVYELRNNTAVYIGSEDYSGFIWWFYVIEPLCSLLNTNPSITTIELGDQIVELLWKHSNDSLNILKELGFDTSEMGLTMAAVRTDKLQAVAEKFDQLSVSWINYLEHIRSNLSSIFSDVTSFHDGTLLDFYSLLTKLETLADEDALYNSTLFYELKQAYDDIIIHECHSAIYECKGLTLYFPDPVSTNLTSSYIFDGYGLDFPYDTNWGNFLYQLFQAKDLFNN